MFASTPERLGRTIVSAFIGVHPRLNLAFLRNANKKINRG
jgi:hypothetical protein